MPHLHPRFASGLLAGTAAVMLASLIGGTAGATDLEGRQTVSNNQKLGQAWTSDGQPIPMAAAAHGLYTVQTGSNATWDSMLTLDRNSQSAEIAGNVAANMLNAKGSHGDGGDYYEPAPFAVLDNYQSGDDIVTATSGMTVSVPGQ